MCKSIAYLSFAVLQQWWTRNQCRAYLLGLVCLSMGAGSGFIEVQVEAQVEKWTTIVPITTGQATQPSIQAQGNNVFIAWSDSRLGASEIFFRRSTDGGQTWGLEQRITETIADSVSPDLDADRRYLYLVWQEDQRVKFALYDGLQWQRQTVLSEAGHRPRIAVTKIFPNNFIYVVWERMSTQSLEANQPSQSSSTQAEIVISDDQGLNWQKVRPLTSVQWESAEPDVAAGFQSAIVAWQDHREATSQIYAKQYQEFKSGPDWRLSSPGNARRPAVAMSRAETSLTSTRLANSPSSLPMTAVTWESRRYQTDPADIWVAETLLNQDLSLYQISDNSAESVSPQIDLGSDQTWLFWRDGSSGNWEIYFSQHQRDQWSTSRSFLPKDHVASLNKSGHSPTFPMVSISQDQVHFVWIESTRETRFLAPAGEAQTRLFYRRRDTQPLPIPSRPIHIDLDAPAGFDNDRNLTFMWQKQGEKINYQIWASINQASFQQIGQTSDSRFEFQPTATGVSYRIRVRAADAVENWSDFSPPSTAVYVDYRPPQLEFHTPSTNEVQIPVIASPRVMVTATCLDDNLTSCQLRLGTGRIPTLSDTWQNLGSAIRTPFTRERIYVWDTTDLDGIYTLSLTAIDTAQNRTTIQSTVIIDNRPPLPISGGSSASLTMGDLADISYYTPAWSPDGNRIAFSSNAAGSVDIWILELQNQSRKRLTRDKWIDLHPSWHPDGQKIAFQSQRPQPKDTEELNWEIWLINADGSSLRQLVDQPAQMPSWSPTGNQLAVAIEQAGDYEIFLASFDNQPTTLLQLTRNSHQDLFPTWSPGMMKIAYQSNRSGNWDIWLTNIDQTNDAAEQLLRQSFANETQPRWSPNGKYLLFLTDRMGGYQVADAIFSQSGQPPVGPKTGLDPTVRSPVRLSPPGVPVVSANWSSDGKYLIYQSKDQLYTVPIVFPTTEVEAQIITPYNRGLVSGKVDLFGLARGRQFQEFHLDYTSAISSQFSDQVDSPSSRGQAWIPIGGRSTQPVNEVGFLGQWDTRRLNGEYILRLTVVASSPPVGLTGDRVKGKQEEMSTGGWKEVEDLQAVFVQNRRPALEILSPFDGTVTNEQTIQLRGRTSAYAQLYLNDQRIELDSSGDFALRLLLKKGENQFNLRATSSVLGETRASRTVFRDSQPPELTLKTPTDFLVSPVPYILVAGTTDSTKLDIRQGTRDTKSSANTVIPVQPDETFQRWVGLQLGPNIITIVATDRFNRESVQHRRIIYTVPDIGKEIANLAPEDNHPPGIVDLSPPNGLIIRQPEEELTISARLIDDVKIDPFSLVFNFDEQTFRFDPDDEADRPAEMADFDGKIFSFDPATGVFTYRPAQELSQGQHQFKLQVSDFQGNTASPISTAFVIDRQPFYASLSAVRDDNVLWVHLVSNKEIETVGNVTVASVPSLLATPNSDDLPTQVYTIGLEPVSTTDLRPEPTLREMSDKKPGVSSSETLFVYQGQFRLISTANSFDLSADLFLRHLSLPTNSSQDDRTIRSVDPIHLDGYYADQNQFQTFPMLPFPQQVQGQSSTIVAYQIQHYQGASLIFLNPQVNLQFQLRSQDGFDANRVLRQMQDAETRQLEIVYPIHQIKYNVEAEVIQNSSFELRIPSEKMSLPVESTALFYWQKSWQPVKNVRRSMINDQVYLTGVVAQLGSYGLLIDRTPPEVQLRQTKSSVIELEVTDGGSGVDRLVVQIDQLVPITLNATGQSRSDRSPEKGMLFRQTNSYTGKLIYLPGSLKPGRHTIQLTAFDRANNSAQFKDTFFSQDIFDFMGQTFAYPNPASGQVQIQFQLTKAADVELGIYNVVGELVYSTQLKAVTGQNSRLKWSCQNRLQQDVAPGIYIFDLKATSSGRTVRRSGKIAVLTRTSINRGYR